MQDVRQRSKPAKLYKNMPPEKVAFAKALRKKATQAEVCLKRRIHGWRLGVKFRFQAPLLGYIADFACGSERLVIEVDGQHHNEPVQRAYDELRDRRFRDGGWRVLRFSNADVLSRPEEVVRAIRRAIQEGTESSTLNAPAKNITWTRSAPNRCATDFESDQRTAPVCSACKTYDPSRIVLSGETRARTCDPARVSAAYGLIQYRYTCMCGHEGWSSNRRLTAFLVP
jgi:very-short-patch-repair endonuclease